MKISSLHLFDCTMIVNAAQAVMVAPTKFASEYSDHVSEVFAFLIILTKLGQNAAIRMAF